LEKTGRGLIVWSELLEQEFEHWQKELSQLPLEEWYQELESQMNFWLKELEQSGMETRKYFREEVLPRLKEAVRELTKRLREIGKEKEVETLEIKLQELKSI
jgi:hypothetical protein